MKNRLIADMFNVQAILAAFRFLAERCDGAQSHDNVGFNGKHAQSDFVMSMIALANDPDGWLSVKQAIPALKVLRTYRNTQLVSMWAEVAKISKLVIEITVKQNGNLWTVEINKEAIPSEIIELKKIDCAMRVSASTKEKAIDEAKSILRAFQLSGVLRVTEI